MKKAMKSGFTLIELLVVVAIIAVIGAGVAVTYNRLDERAKVAMELNDIGVLEKTINHWSFLHDGKLPNRLDSLVQTDGSSLYTAMGTGSSGNGLSMQAGFTFEAKKAPEYVMNQLSAVGIDTVYMHYPEVLPANDSTYTNDTSAAKKMDTSGTVATLDADAESVADNLAQMQAIVDQSAAAQEAFAEGNPYTLTWTDSSGNPQSRTFPAAMAAMWPTILNSAQETVDSAGGNLLDTLAFLWPEGGTQMGMNLANEIIINAGLNPDLVASPEQDVDAARADGKGYWLVVFGIGRFADIYTGNGARVLEPVSGKRYTEENLYNRYLMVVKVPVYGYDNMTGQGNQKASVAAILSPNGLSRTRLDSTYRDAEKATSN
ncbi:MAG: type II secretion system protein [Kiritimatiellae bacterium]|nr:type II secretion system protein [Kiritimatiellia bacterium]